VVLVAALIAAEKLLPWRKVATRGIVVLLAVLAAAVAFAPHDVPGLTIPGSPAAMDAMEHMEMESTEPARPMRMDDRTGTTPQLPSRSKASDSERGASHPAELHSRSP
jgi:hypothetical protein